MPEEEKPGLESTGNFEKDIYVDSEVFDSFWVGDSDSDYVKPANGPLGTLILDECDEKVILLMKSMLEGQVISDGSDAYSSDDEAPMVVEEKFRINDFEGGQEQGEGNNFYQSQDVSKVVEVTTPMGSSETEGSKSRGDLSLIYDQEDKLQYHENGNRISSGTEVEENVNLIQQCPATIPYSGSISLGSTSSTASTQSFAFPVLAQEWNSSPIRMAKPDKKQLRKQKRGKTKMGWLCCKF